MSLWKANGYRPDTKPEPLREHPNDPPHFPWIWEWLFDFPHGASWQEIDAWSRVRGINPQGWECRLLMRLDALRH